MRYERFDTAIGYAAHRLIHFGEDVDAGSWQGYDTSGRPDLVTKEILNLQIEVPVWRVNEEGNDFLDFNLMELQSEIKPNLPWADDHFDERVSRVPSNPGWEYQNWPWWRGQDDETRTYSRHHEPDQFSHTYQERFWPKQAGRITQRPKDSSSGKRGIRYAYGDLDDVVTLLFDNPYTRQAAFPIFFPEDTGAVHGGRVPCTMHYHFLMRNNQLHLWYPIRSCDLVRHFQDDLYLACRLLLWVLEELRERELRSDTPQLWVDARPGTLFFTAYSFHVHKGDLHHVHHSA